MDLAERQIAIEGQQERLISMRAKFAYEIHLRMTTEERIFVVTGDLGYKMWDQVKRDFPDRFINVGAAEQVLVGVSVGLALRGKIPFALLILEILIRPPL